MCKETVRAHCLLCTTCLLTTQWTYSSCYQPQKMKLACLYLVLLRARLGETRSRGCARRSPTKAMHLPPPLCKEKVRAHCLLCTTCLLTTQWTYSSCYQPQKMKLACLYLVLLRARLGETRGRGCARRSPTKAVPCHDILLASTSLPCSYMSATPQRARNELGRCSRSLSAAAVRPRLPGFGPWSSGWACWEGWHLAAAA